MRRTVAWILLLLLSASPLPGSNSPQPGKYKGCPEAGTDGDTALNTLKNRSGQAEDAATKTVRQVVNFADPGVTNHLPRYKWSAAQLQTVKKYEDQGVSVEGYLVGVQPEGAERCNCRKPQNNDYHVWLGSSSDSTKDEAIVIEVTPRWRGANPAWSKENLRALKKQGAKVRITGWPLFDQEHLNEIGNSRATAWEIHPITKIEVFQDGAWEELQ